MWRFGESYVPSIEPFPVIKRALYSIKRALYSIKRSLYSIKRALSSIKRVLYSIRTALCSIKRALDSVSYQTSPIFYQISPFLYEKSPIFHHRSPRFSSSNKQALHFIKHTLYSFKWARSSMKRALFPITGALDFHLLSNKPWILFTRPAFCQMSPFLDEKSHIFYHRSPRFSSSITPALHSAKWALSSTKRALHFIIGALDFHPPSNEPHSP